MAKNNDVKNAILNILYDYWFVGLLQAKIVREKQLECCDPMSCLHLRTIVKGRGI